MRHNNNRYVSVLTGRQIEPTSKCDPFGFEFDILTYVQASSRWPYQISRQGAVQAHDTTNAQYQSSYE